MKKQIIAGMAAAMVCVGAVGGTFAYLTQTTETVNNTFTVGNNVQISLDEARVTELGVPAVEDEITGEISEVGSVKDADKVLANTYKLMPNHEYVKNPTVHVDDESEKCYVFIHVNNPISAIEAEAGTKMEDGNDYVQIAQQITNHGWVPVTGDGYAGYYYKADPIDPTVEPAEGEELDLDLEVFDNFMITKDAYIDKSETAEKNDMNLNEYLNKQITITACAVQADGFESATDVITANALPEGFRPANTSTDAPTE